VIDMSETSDPEYSGHPWHDPLALEPALDELGRPLGVPDRDPFAAERTDDQPSFDVLCAGTVFYDLIFTGLESPPALGRELWTRGMGSSPGGIANLAVGLRRLGLRTGLASCFGEDLYGDFCWETLAGQEGVDLSLSRRCPGWHSPVTVSLAYDRDRAMITHGHEPPLSADALIARPPQARAAIVSLRESLDSWAVEAATGGTLLLADVGWDPTGVWSSVVLEQLGRCHAFLPNHAEAMLYTRTDTPADALHRLADRVPVAVVTCGPRGAIAVDSTTGEEVDVPSVPIDALDATGAGDIFVAGFTVATLAGWSLRRRVAFATLTAGLSVRHFGGSLSAPGWADVDAWWRTTRAAARHGDWSARELASSFSFLDEVVPRPSDGHEPDPSQARRAPVTLGFREPGFPEPPAD
jgi:sugar/nucleoside kinase (ribokinase family)